MIIKDKNQFIYLKRICVFILFVICFSYLEAQEYRFKHLNVENGLSHVSVANIYQDEFGRMWFATHDGLDCFDGNSVREFRKQELQNHQSINILQIIQLAGDKHGHMFLRSANSVFQLDLRTEKLKIIVDFQVNSIAYFDNRLWLSVENKLLGFNVSTQKFDTKYIINLPNVSVNSIHSTDNKTFWLATSNYGLVEFNGRTKLINKYFETSWGRVIINDNKNRLWYATNNEGVYCIDLKSKKLIRQYKNIAGNNSTILDGYNRTIVDDNLGNIWVGSNKGLSCIQPASGIITRYTPTPSITSITSASVNHIYKDAQGTIWIGNYFGGVNYFNPGNTDYEFLFTTETDHNIFPAIGSICEDKNNMMWVGSEGAGVYCFSPENKSLKMFNAENSGLSSNYVKHIIRDTQTGNLWIASDMTNVLSYIDVNTYKINHINIQTDDLTPARIIAVASYMNDIFVGTDAGVIRYNKITRKANVIYKLKGLYSANLNDLFIDNAKRLWFATNVYPVSYSLETNELTYYTYNVVHNKQDSQNIPSIFYQTNEGKILLGTNGFGLLQLNEKDKSFDVIPALHQINTNTILSMAETKSNKLLIGTTKSVFVLDKKTQLLSELKCNIHLPVKSLIKRGLSVSHNGDIYIAGVPGFVVYNEKKLFGKKNPDEIQLTNLYINNEEVRTGDKSGILQTSLPYTTSITLNSKQNYITFVYATNNYLNSSNERVEYKLDGYDSKWMQASLGHTITYTNLSPGNYTFKIRVVDNKEIIKTLDLHIVPPFYQSVWAYILYIIIGLFVVYYFVKEYNTRISLRTSLLYKEREKTQIEEMNQSKIQFFINVSHEIRTPITLILAQTEILLNSVQLHSSARSKIANIHRHLLSLKHLVNELMDFRKQEKGELPMKFCEVDLIAILREHYNLFKGLAHSKNIEFNFITDVDRVFVWIDPEQMLKVINNLTVNALKFINNSGHFTISVKEDSELVEMIFEDNGIGIPEADIAKIFDRFYQAGNTNQLGGSGIGLALTKGIVDAHGGTIKVESSEGKGSTFVVTIRKGNSHLDPAKLNHQKTELIDTYRAEVVEPAIELQVEENTVNDIQVPNANERATVLLVEDNNEILEMLSGVFSSLYNVMQASDGKQAWSILRDSQIDLVITDVMMPNMTGTELCVRIKNNFEFCHIPVILLTARQSDEYEIEGMRLGADSYLTKPFEMKKLISISHNLIYSRKLLQMKFAQNRKLEPTDVAVNESDKEFMTKLTAIVLEHIEDEKFNVDIMAKEIGVSRTKLFMKLKDVAGTTPNKFILDLRLRKAAEDLLNDPSKNVADISFRFCFNSPRYFNKCFNDMFGVSPLTYRRENTGKTK